MKQDLKDLIINNENLIHSIIKSYTKYAEYDDLFQVASIGLIKAYQKFDPTFNTKFTTYAYSYIKGEVYKYVNDNKMIKLGSKYLEMSKLISKAQSYLSQQLMHFPSNQELADFLEIPLYQIEHCIIMSSQVDSLDRNINDDGNQLDLYGCIEDISQKTLDISFQEQMNNLQEEEQRLVQLRYFQGFTQQEVATIMGINQSKISRTEKKVLQKLKVN
ncbi:MAG: sigma-70 family RNA polymerase sigma factor [bacterium]|nr:sigma-70 family RNA polymerase sigma factor [bacterium]